MIANCLDRELGSAPDALESPKNLALVIQHLLASPRSPILQGGQLRTGIAEPGKYWSPGGRLKPLKSLLEAGRLLHVKALLVVDPLATKMRLLGN